MRNQFEERVYKELKKVRCKVKYESEVLAYTIHRTYIPDFVITTKTGKKIYLECKGFLRREHKSKMVAVKKCHPELDIRILFYSMNKSNIKWATKNKFPWAIWTIPLEWINE